MFQRAGQSLDEVAYDFAHQWWEKQNGKPMADAFFSIGLSMVASKQLEQILTPLLDICYDHGQILDIAIEYLDGDYKL